MRLGAVLVARLVNDDFGFIKAEHIVKGDYAAPFRREHRADKRGGSHLEIRRPARSDEIMRN